MSVTLIWFCTALVCFAAEIITFKFLMSFFGLGALVSGIISMVEHDLVFEIYVFSLVSIGSLILFRRRAIAYFGRSLNPFGKNYKPSGHAGRIGIVKKAIPVGGEGQISLDGKTWRAVAREDIPKGADIKVIGHMRGSETILLVTQIEDN